MNQTEHVAPYWRLSGFYFFYFASLGALVPYWGLYLKSLDFNEAAIGELTAVIMATKIIAPNIWGWIADHRGQRMHVVRIASLLAAICFAGVFLGSSYGWLLVVMVAFSFFWNAALPQFEATTMTHLGEGVHRYSGIRLWGSIGFILTVVGLGFLFQNQPIQLLPYILVILFSAIWLNTLLVVERKVSHESTQHHSIINIVRKPEVLAILWVCFLVQASHGGYYTFYSLYLEANQYNRQLIGELWALGVVSEIILFLFMYRLLPRFGARNLVLCALLLTTLRWLIIGQMVNSLLWLILAQTLHAASFGIFHAVCIYLFHKFFVGKHQGQGQALYSSVSFGAGGAMGSLLSGYIWDSLGAEWVYLSAAIVSGLAIPIAWYGIRLRT